MSRGGGPRSTRTLGSVTNLCCWCNERLPETRIPGQEGALTGARSARSYRGSPGGGACTPDKRKPRPPPWREGEEARSLDETPRPDGPGGGLAPCASATYGNICIYGSVACRRSDTRHVRSLVFSGKRGEGQRKTHF